jgi:hypothetical protein
MIDDCRNDHLRQIVRGNVNGGENAEAYVDLFMWESINQSTVPASLLDLILTTL